MAAKTTAHMKWCWG